MTKYSIWKPLRTHQAHPTSLLVLARGRKWGTQKLSPNLRNLCLASMQFHKVLNLSPLLEHILSWSPQFSPLPIVLYPTIPHTYVICLWPLKTFKFTTLAKLLQSDEIIYCIGRRIHPEPYTTIQNLKQEGIKDITFTNSGKIVNNTRNMSFEGFKI